MKILFWSINVRQSIKCRGVLVYLWLAIFFYDSFAEWIYDITATVEILTDALETDESGWGIVTILS